jgi:hypothetical protein
VLLVLCLLNTFFEFYFVQCDMREAYIEDNMFHVAMIYFICCMKLRVGCFRPCSLLLQHDHVWILKVQHILFNWIGRTAIGLEINNGVFMCWELGKYSLKQSGAKLDLCWSWGMNDITWYKQKEVLHLAQFSAKLIS